MALPLLLGVAAGYLGAGQFLMKKQDDRDAQSLFDKSQFAGMPGLDGSERDAQYQITAQSLLDEDFGFFDASKADQMRQLQQAYEQEFGARQQRIEQQEQQNWDRSQSVTNQIDQDYNRDLRTFGSVVQPAYQQAVNALSPGMNSADSVAALYNFFNIMEPGGRVTENEDGSFTGIGGSGAKLANWLNAARGGGLTDETREQILSAINNQYRPQLDRARRQRFHYDKLMTQYGNEGLNIRSPIGSIGIDYDSEPTTGFGPELGADGQPVVPDGFSIRKY